MPFACNCKERQRQRASRIKCGGYNSSRNRFVIVAQLENFNSTNHQVLNDIHQNFSKKNNNIKVLPKINKNETLDLQTTKNLNKAENTNIQENTKFDSIDKLESNKELIVQPDVLTESDNLIDIETGLCKKRKLKNDVLSNLLPNKVSKNSEQSSVTDIFKCFFFVKKRLLY